MKAIKMLLLLAVISVSSATFSLGQASGTTGVGGSVKDAQGAIVAGATVTLSNAAKGFSRTVISNESGLYNFAAISPDTYTITVEKTGFKKYIQNDVRAAIDTQVEISVSLEVGAVSESVKIGRAHV